MSAKEIDIASYVDHTCLNADASESAIQKLCDEAIKFKFKTVCINPIYVQTAARCLKGSAVYPITVVGFPLGANCTETKVFETKVAIEHGAKEIDMVINIGQLKNGNYGLVENDIKAVVITADTVPVKVIIETALLTQEEKVLACKLSKSAGADFVKTSTGFSKSGATVEDIKLMRSTVGSEMGVKASGGIRTHADAKAMIEAGATRIGASAGAALLGKDSGSTSAKEDGY